MNSIGASILILLISIILFFPRRWAVLGITAGIFYLTPQQGLMIGGFNLFAFRLIELAGLTRFIFRKDAKLDKINEVDKWFYLFNIVILSMFMFRCIVDVNSRWRITYQLGVFVDAAITYIVYRGLLSSEDKINMFIKDLIYILIPFAVFMFIEYIEGINIFSYMSGNPIAPILRKGLYRCQASFGHAILAGSVGATLLPVFLFILLVGGNYIIAGIALVVCLIIVITSNSSGPLVALFSGIIAWMFWPVRKNLRIVRWGIVGILIFLHIIMKVEVWFLPARISEIIGGDGWHRANLIDKWIDSIGQWWLMGMSWSNTENWAATRMPWGGVDATNEYVSIAVNGGIVSLIFFIVYLLMCYKNLGRKMEIARNNGWKKTELLCWGLGASLTTHIINLTGVTYWDQFYAIWYMTLAMISGITDITLTSRINDEYS